MINDYDPQVDGNLLACSDFTCDRLTPGGWSPWLLSRILNIDELKHDDDLVKVMIINPQKDQMVISFTPAFFSSGGWQAGGELLNRRSDYIFMSQIHKYGNAQIRKYTNRKLNELLKVKGQINLVVPTSDLYGKSSCLQSFETKHWKHKFKSPMNLYDFAFWSTFVFAIYKIHTSGELYLLP